MRHFTLYQNPELRFNNPGRPVCARAPPSWLAHYSRKERSIENYPPSNGGKTSVEPILKANKEFVNESFKPCPHEPHPPASRTSR